MIRIDPLPEGWILLHAAHAGRHVGVIVKTKRLPVRYVIEGTDAAGRTFWGEESGEVARDLVVETIVHAFRAETGYVEPPAPTDPEHGEA